MAYCSTSFLAILGHPRAKMLENHQAMESKIQEGATRPLLGNLQMQFPKYSMPNEY